MEITCQLAPLVFYDDYDTHGYLLDIKHGVLNELNEGETHILSTLLSSATLPEAIQHLTMGAPSQSPFQVGEGEVLTFVQRLQDQQLLEPGREPLPSCAPLRKMFPQNRAEPPAARVNPVTWRQRLRGAGHIITLLGELCTGAQGLYNAHQYMWKLKEHCETVTIAPANVVELVRKEYGFYRLIVGLLERRAAHLIGQTPGNEGLCLIRSLALCAYLLSLGIPATVVIARPLYGSRDGFKLHVWTELMDDETPLNERPNIGHGYRRLYSFPGNVSKSLQEN